MMWTLFRYQVRYRIKLRESQPYYAKTIFASGYFYKGIDKDIETYLLVRAIGLLMLRLSDDVGLCRNLKPSVTKITDYHALKYS